MVIVDSQIHIWELSRPDRSWPEGRFLPPWSATPYSKEDALAAMDQAGVDRAVLVPPAFEGDRNDISLQAAAEHPDRFAVMGRLPLDSPETKELLPLWKSNPGALGLRFTFFIPRQRAWLEDGTADWLWQIAEEHAVPLMVYPVPEALPKFHAIAERHPGLKLVIDHLAVGHEEWNRDDRAFAHIDDLAALARHPNVAVKASGLPEYSSENYPYKGLHKYIRKITDAYGSRRVFWGTDLQRLPCTYSQAITMFTEELDWLSDEDLQWIMGRGICEWLDWPVGTENAPAA